jgi:hypothetical protein
MGRAAGAAPPEVGGRAQAERRPVEPHGDELKERAQTIVVRTGVKARRNTLNHTGVAVRTQVTGGRVVLNHSRGAVRSQVKAGKVAMNHSGVAVRTRVKAGKIGLNHSAAEAR